MSVRTRIVLSTLCVFNAFLLLLIGAGALAFVDGRPRFAIAAVMWIAAIVLLTLSHALRRGSEET